MKGGDRDRNIDRDWETCDEGRDGEMEIEAGARAWASSERGNEV